MTNEEAAAWIDSLQALDTEAEEAKRMAIEALKERKTGKWVLVEMGDTDLYECSLCRNRKTYTPPFCDVCGAKMEDQNNDE